MQTALLNKICIVRAKEGINGYPACLALLKRAMVKSNLDVHSLLFLHLQRELPSLFRDNQRFNAIQCLDVNSLEEVRTRLDAQNISKNSLIFIDSLSLLIEQFSLPSTSWLLNQLSELSTCVLALIGSGLEEDLDIWRRVEFISTTIFQLETAEDSDVLLCRTIDRKKDETFETKFEQFTIRPDYSIEASPYVEPDTATKILKEVQLLSLQQQQEKDKASQEGGAGSKFGFDKLPFDVGLNLSEQERRAKANLQLPYMAAQSQKGLVGMNISSGKKLRAGGQIIYTPDKEDDFDESDPDDDLAI